MNHNNIPFDLPKPVARFLIGAVDVALEEGRCLRRRGSRGLGLLVLHRVLEYSGMSPIIVWGTSVIVLLAVVAINRTFGVMAGTSSLRTATNQGMELVAVLSVVGVGAMVIAFLLLTVFRAQVANSHREAIRPVPNDDTRAQHHQTTHTLRIVLMALSDLDR